MEEFICERMQFIELVLKFLGPRGFSQQVIRKTYVFSKISREKRLSDSTTSLTDHLTSVKILPALVVLSSTMILPVVHIPSALQHSQE
jgi:hypothetical protein